jgi:cell division protein FtsL
MVALLMGLVGLRLYSLNLEYQLADIQRQIVLREEEQSRLEKDLAGLLNPTRVYSYARSKLGMSASSSIGVVKVAAFNTEPSVHQGYDRADLGVIRKALVWLVDSMSRKASARQ